jgi:hypothetical protein
VAQVYPQALGSLFVASSDSQGYGGGIQTHFHTGITQLYLLLVGVKVKVKVTLQLAVYHQSVGIKPLETHDFFFLN